jgi:hypothetical protein
MSVVIWDHQVGIHAEPAGKNTELSLSTSLSTILEIGKWGLEEMFSKFGKSHWNRKVNKQCNLRFA